MSFVRFIRGVAAAALATAALIASPVMAQAVGETYPPSDSYISVQPAATVAPGGKVNLAFIPGSFGPGQMVSFALTGESATGSTLALIRTSVDTLGTNKVAVSDGSLAVSISLPATATGNYNLTAAVPGWTRTWAFTVDSSEAGSGLVLTGTEPNQLLWALIAGGAIAVVGGSVFVGNSVRKQRKFSE